MIDYLNMGEVEREYSQYPRGLKHYRKEEVFENSLFDIDLLAYKIASILKGQDDETLRGREENNETETQEILRGDLLGRVHQDGSTAADPDEDRGSGEVCEEESQELREEREKGEARSDKGVQESSQE